MSPDALDAFPDADDLLAGLPARRASTLLFLIESRTAHLVARSRQATELLLTEEGAQERELAFVEAFAASREPPLRPSIQDIERHSVAWAPLVGGNRRVQAAVARRLGEKYEFTYDAVPGIRAALDLDEPAVADSYERLYREPLTAIFATRAGFRQRLRWRWSRLAAGLENVPPFWMAFSLTLTEIVGVSILALPIAIAAVGPLPGLGVLAVLGLVNALTVAFLAEAVSRSGPMRYGRAFYGRLVTDFLGPGAAVVLTGSLFIFCFVVLLVYYVGIATTLDDATSVPEAAWVALVFLFGLYFVRRESLGATVASALVVGGLTVGLIVVLCLLAFAHADPDNLLYENVPFVGGTSFEPALLALIFGVVLTAYHGHLAVAICGPLVLDRDPSARSLIRGCVAAQATAMVLYSLFVLGVNGAVAPERLAEESGTALAPLAETAGPAVHAIGAAFVVLGMGMTSITLSLALSGLVRERLPAVASRLVTLPRRRARLLFSERRWAAAGRRLKVGVTYLGLDGRRPRFLVELERGGLTRRLEAIAEPRWDVLGADGASALGEGSGPSPELAFEIDHARDQSVRVRVTTTLRMDYEGAWDSTGLGLGELLALSDSEAAIVGWIMRRGEVTAAETAAHTADSEPAVERDLQALAARGVLGERRVAGESRYAARPAARRAGRLPEDLAQALAEAGDATDAPSSSSRPADVAPGRPGRMLGKSARFMLAAAPVLLAFLAAEWMALTGSGSFAGAISFVGAICVSIMAGVFPVLLLASSRRKGERIPATVGRRLSGPLLLGTVYALFLAGVLLNGLVIWDEPLERVGALVTAAAIVGLTVNAVRRGAFKPRLAIELCDDRAGGGASFAIMAGGGRVQGDVRLGYPGRERRVRAATGEIEDFGSLRRASFEACSGDAAAEDCAELKVWAHRITLDGESEGLAGRLLVEPDDDGERLDLPLSRGQILLPLAGVPRRLDIVPDETS
jgi:amino acid permease